MAKGVLPAANTQTTLVATPRSRSRGGYGLCGSTLESGTQG